MSRLNWSNSRQSPTDQDDITPTEIDYSFDYHRGSKPGEPSWPATHSGQKFGPAFIRKVWQQGMVVYAEIEGFPRPVAVTECTWGAQGVLLVKTLEGQKVAERLFTRPDAKGLSSCGELLSSEDE